MLTVEVIMSCLIIKNDGIGDLILASGIIAELSKLFDGNLDLVTCRTNREVAENLSGVRDRYYVSRDDLRFRPIAARFGLLLPIAKGDDRVTLTKISEQEYDIAICLRRYIRQSTLVVMSVVRAKDKRCAWQFPTNISAQFAERCSKGWTRYSGSIEVLSELKYFQSFIEHTLSTRIEPSPQLNGLDSFATRPEPMAVGIGIGGGSTNWPPNYWITLVSKLDESGYKVFLFGGTDVTSLANEIQEKMDKVTNLVGTVSFYESLPYLQKLSVYIGNDTGFSHFSSLIVPKCLVILGGGTFRRFFPWPESDNQYIIFHGLDCYDCDWQCKFKERHCMNKLLPTDVLDYFFEIVKDSCVDRVRNTNSSVEEYHVAWRRWNGKSKYLPFQR